jgi:lipoprotein-releasing system permease protein
MNLRLIFEIALSLLVARFRQTVVAAVGVTFSIAMFIALLSFMNGLNQMLDGLILNRTPHVRLYNEVKPLDVQPVELATRYQGHHHFIRSIKPKDRGLEIYNSQAIIQALKAEPGVIDVAPKVSTQVFFHAGTIEIAGVINGIDVVTEEKLFSFSDYVIEGDVEDLATMGNSIFIGKGIADKMMVEVGDMLQVTTPRGQLASLKVMGIIQFGLADLDNVVSYTSLPTAQKLLGKPAAYVTDIQVKLTDLDQAPAMAKAYSSTYGVEAADIQTANAQFDTGSSIRSTISYAVGITLLIVAGFGIYNILNMLIYEKMDTIAILKATGFSGRDVQWIFILLSLIIGVSGGIMGLGIGYLLSVGIDQVPFETEALPTIKTFPVYYNPAYYFIGITFALITTYLAGLLPARKAAQVDPVIIIRGK